MNSQATFVVLSANIPNKVYKIKIFRNGRIQIPGIVNDNLNDAIDVINEARLVVIDALGLDEDTVQMQNSKGGQIGIVMKITKWRIMDGDGDVDKFIVNQNAFKELLIDRKDSYENVMFLAHDIKLNFEKYQGLTFGLKSKNYHTYSTYRIFNSGKINLVHYNDQEENKILMNWLIDFLNDNRDVFLYDQTISDSDTDSQDDNQIDKDIELI